MRAVLEKPRSFWLENTAQVLIIKVKVKKVKD
jgi:hypothetical protein